MSKAQNIFARQTRYAGVDNATPIRNPATANLFIDSLDKTSGDSANFAISTNGQPLAAGFFNRMAVAEVVMDWGLPNISPVWGNNTFTVRSATPQTFTVTLPEGFYTATTALEVIASLLNTAFGGAFFSVGGASPVPTISLGCSIPGGYSILWDFTSQNALCRQLFASSQLTPIAGPYTPQVSYTCVSPRILGTTYVDIVCNQLTQNQGLSDSTTSPVRRDILYRWYLAWDNVPPQGDLGLNQVAGGSGGTFQPGYPILQGYTPFLCRRTPPFPKQIRWEDDTSIGSLQFNLYDDRGLQIPLAGFTSGYNLQYQISLLLSED
jgi:hypothetical protein